MKTNIWRLVLILTIVLTIFPNLVKAQQRDTTRAEATFNQDEVISLDIQEIKITIEKPQVTIISDRIKPEFDEVHLDKSFFRELRGEGEKFIFEIEDKFEAKQRIDINQFLKRNR
jgi:hypothetical protein